MNPNWRLATLLLVLIANVLFFTPMFSKETSSTKPLKLKATLETHDIALGTEFSPSVCVVNTSGRAINLEYVKPLLMVPVIVDAKTNKVVQNAPTYVYSQVSAFEKKALPPDGELSLYALPILVKSETSTAIEVKHAHAFWNTHPGPFIMKYSVQLKQLVPGSEGELHLDVPIRIIDSK